MTVTKKKKKMVHADYVKSLLRIVQISSNGLRRLKNSKKTSKLPQL